MTSESLVTSRWTILSFYNNFPEHPTPLPVPSSRLAGCGGYTRAGPGQSVRIMGPAILRLVTPPSSNFQGLRSCGPDSHHPTGLLSPESPVFSLVASCPLPSMTQPRALSPLTWEEPQTTQVAATVSLLSPLATSRSERHVALTSALLAVTPYPTPNPHLGCFFQL